MTISKISNLNHFVETQYLGSAVAFIDSGDSSSPTILSKLDQLAETTPSGFGFGFIDATATENMDVCKQQEVCLFPIVKFYRPDGQATSDCWIGAEQIIQSASDSHYNNDWLDS